MKMSIKTTVVVAATALASATLAACGGGSGGDSDTITLGVVGPLTGAQAEIGKDQVAGAEVAVAQINADGGIDGKKVKLVKKDEGASPDTAAKALRAFGNDDVNLVVGMLSSANCLATAPNLERLKVTLMVANCTNDALTGQKGKKAPYSNLFRIGTPDSPLIEALGSFTAKKFPEVTEYDAFGYDYVTGTSQWKLYQKVLKQDGVDVKPRKQTFVALGEQNFKPYVQALSGGSTPKAKRGLYLGTFGAGTASFLQQAQDLSLTSQYSFVIQPGGYYPVARTLGGRAPKVWNAYDFSYAAFDSDLSKSFVDDFKKKTGKMPESWAYDTYLGVQAYKAAIEKAGSADYDDVLKALPGISFEAANGKVTIDATTHQANIPVVVTHSVGDKKATENVRFLETHVVKSGD